MGACTYSRANRVLPPTRRRITMPALYITPKGTSETETGIPTRIFNPHIQFQPLTHRANPPIPTAWAKLGLSPSPSLSLRRRAVTGRIQLWLLIREVRAVRDARKAFGVAGHPAWTMSCPLPPYHPVPLLTLFCPFFAKSRIREFGDWEIHTAAATTPHPPDSGPRLMACLRVR